MLFLSVALAVLPVLANGLEQAVTKEWLIDLLNNNLTPSKAPPSKAVSKATHKKRIVHFLNPQSSRVYFDVPEYCSFINELSVSESEDDSSIIRTPSLVIIDQSKQNELSLAMFDCATCKEPIDGARLRKLLEKKRHRFLNSAMNKLIMARVIDSLLGKEKASEELFQAFQLMLSVGFASSIMGQDLLRLFSSQRLMEAVLTANRFIFKEKLQASILAIPIYQNNYDLLEMLLLLGANPKAVEGGLTVLDRLYLANSHCQLLLSGLADAPDSFKGGIEGYFNHCSSLESSRKSLISALEAGGMELSNTMENYESALEAKLYPHAALILYEGGFGGRKEFRGDDVQVSPLSAALKSGHGGPLKRSWINTWKS